MVLFKSIFKVPKHGISKNSKQILSNKSTGKPFIAKSNSAIFLEKYLIRQLTIERIKQRIETITCDINSQLIFYYPNTIYFTKKGERSKTIGDLSNLYQMVEDSLQKSGIICNDTQICSHDGSRRVSSDGTEYYLEIELRKYNG